MYTLLPHLYPREFRDEFADEMKQVFADAAIESARRGAVALLVLCLRELRDVPHSALCERLHRFTQGKGTTMTHRDEDMPNATQIKPVTWAETLAGMTPFLLYPLLIAIGSVSNTLVTLSSPLRAFDDIIRATITLLPIATFMIVLVFLWMRNFPRWSFP